MNDRQIRRSGGARARALALSLLLAGGLASGCASNGPDPYQGMNQGFFAFNEGLDKIVVEPIAKGWDFVMPGFVQTGVGNFFDNLRMLRTTVNDLMQGKPGRAGADLGRFVVNTTVGIVGLVDVATLMEIPHYEEDFGQTLGVWGLGPGAYLVIPFLGPSSGRDLAGLPVDFVTVPTAYGISAIDMVNTRAKFLEEIAENRATSLDYYVFVRNAYLQNRAQRVADGEETTGEGEEDFFDLEGEGQGFDDSGESGDDAAFD